MAIKSPKQKGSAGELEASRLLMSWGSQVGVSLELERNLNQAREGGADINGVDGLEIEVKRVENLNIKAAWDQVCRACAKSGKQPLLMHRKNRQPWRMRTLINIALHINGVWELVPALVDLEEPEGKRWFQSYVKLTYHQQGAHNG